MCARMINCGLVLLLFSTHFVQVENTLDNQVNKVHKRCLESYKMMSEEQLSRYIDASGKPGSGIYWMNNIWFGSFAECKKLKHSRYCLVSFNTFVDMGYHQLMTLFPLQWGACIPSYCTKENVKYILPFLIKNISKIPVFPFPEESMNLQIHCDESPKYTSLVVLTIVLCGIVAALCLVATIFDTLNNFAVEKKLSDVAENASNISQLDTNAIENVPLLEDKRGTSVTNNNSTVSIYKVLNCFSLTRNTNIVLNTNVGKGDLSCLHGVRVLSLFWVILYHCVLEAIKGEIPMDNPIGAVFQLGQHKTAMALLYGSLAVDSFLVISGLLLMYATLNKLEKNDNRIHWLQFYFHRFWRLTPSYLFALLFVVKLRPFIGDGPWTYKLRDTSKCDDYWWTNVLYVNNFHPSYLEESCMVQTWYLALDMQFFVLSPILIIVYRRFGFKVFCSAGSFVVLASIVTTAIIAGTKDAYPVLPYPTIENVESFKDFIKVLYTKPYTRASSYIVGMILGCIVARNRGKVVKLKWYWVLLLWILAVGTALAIVYAPYTAIKEDAHNWSRGEKALFAGLRYFLWSLCVGWVIFACNFNYAGLIKSILSEKFWVPLSRMNYAAFILHYDILYVVVHNNEAPLHMNTFTLINIYITVLVLSYAAGFILAVAFELPCANLESLFMKRNQNQ